MTAAYHFLFCADAQSSVRTKPEGVQRAVLIPTQRRRAKNDHVEGIEIALSRPANSRALVGTGPGDQNFLQCTFRHSSKKSAKVTN
jgi:hypothetical protein